VLTRKAEDEQCQNSNEHLEQRGGCLANEGG